MSVKVLKFGGTSVSDLERLENVANIIKKEVLQGNKVAIVVSAMAGITDQLVGFAKALSSSIHNQEYDVVASSGEQVSAGLLSLSLLKQNIDAKSFLAWQLPIRTTNDYSNAEIIDINVDSILHCFSSGVVPIVAGFQGIDKENRLTTLGRGGSDTTAVALAYYLKADFCDIYTDVDGVYTADPRIVESAKKQNTLSYYEMFEMACSGAKVLHPKAVEIAMKHKINLRVLSSFEKDSKGTVITDNKKYMNDKNVRAIAHSLNDARVVVKNLKNVPGIAAKIYSIFANNNISIDMMTKSHTKENFCDMEVTIEQKDIDRFEKAFLNNKSELEFSDIIVDKNIAKITIVGNGLQSNLEIPKIMCNVLADEKINIYMLNSSQIKLSVVINKNFVSNAIIALHQAFNLHNSHNKEVA